jgi:uncharacterized protein HemX
VAKQRLQQLLQAHMLLLLLVMLALAAAVLLHLQQVLLQKQHQLQQCQQHQQQHLQHQHQLLLLLLVVYHQSYLTKQQQPQQHLPMHGRSSSAREPARVEAGATSMRWRCRSSNRKSSSSRACAGAIVSSASICGACVSS